MHTYVKEDKYTWVYLGRTSLSLSDNTPFSLKELNEVLGGNLNGLLPKLKMHCWKVMKLAAAKNPFLKKRKWNIDTAYASQ